MNQIDIKPIPSISRVSKTLMDGLFKNRQLIPMTPAFLLAARSKGPLDHLLICSRPPSRGWHVIEISCRFLCSKVSEPGCYCYFRVKVTFARMSEDVLPRRA